MKNLISDALRNPLHSWSVGTVAAVGEFRWAAEEETSGGQAADEYIRLSGLGGLRVFPRDDVRIIAYDTLSSDGETWGQAVAFCLPLPTEKSMAVIRNLGKDADALRGQDRESVIFDMGVGAGHVRMYARTADPELIEAFSTLEGKTIFDPEASGLMALIVKAQPHRVMLTPVARLEVYTPVPPPGGQSPTGPHTHLFPNQIAGGRTHDANAPIPEGLQPVLMMHPRSPWRDDMGKRTPYDRDLDEAFLTLRERYGLEADRQVREAVEKAIAGGSAPEEFAWPQSRRGRNQGRITLRRLARENRTAALEQWLAAYDSRASEEAEPAQASS